MWYQNIRSALFSFVTTHASDRQTDRRTDGQNCVSNIMRCITCRTVKIKTVNLLYNSNRPTGRLQGNNSGGLLGPIVLGPRRPLHSY